MFDSYIGIHYAGAETSSSRLKSLAVYRADGSGEPEKVITPDAYPFGPQNWSRKGIAEWVIEQTTAEPVIVGLGHCFSLPKTWFDLQTLPDWSEMLRHFPLWWPTHKPNMYVCFTLDREDSVPPGGTPDQLRITETRMPGAKGIFRFVGHGAMGQISWAGIPWLAHIREKVGDRVHFWPFDGWSPPEGKSVIAEVSPFMFSRSYPKERRSPQEHDAYSVARWMSEMDRTDRLETYFHPHLTDEERRIAETIEGWVLGVM